LVATYRANISAKLAGLDIRDPGSETGEVYLEYGRTFIERLKVRGQPVRFVWCFDGGEDKALVLEVGLIGPEEAEPEPEAPPREH
jgi:hypothetical protein